MSSTERADRGGRTQADIMRYRRLVRGMAHLLDNSIPVPGTDRRFGLDPIIGLVPGVGDVVGGVISSYLLYLAMRLGAPRSVLLRMAFNVAVETALGVIPVLGDLFDAWWKSNARNAELLERYLDNPGRTAGASAGFVTAVILVLLLLAAGAVWLVVALIRWLAQL